MILDSLRTLLLQELRELYAAEMLEEEALGRFIKAANTPELKTVLGEQRVLLEGHPRRLEALFRHLSESPRGGSAASMKAMLRETEVRLGEGGDHPVLDAALIAAARRFVLWEIAAYETAAVYADRVGLDEPAALLRRTLEDKRAMGSRLLDLAGSLPLLGKDEA